MDTFAFKKSERLPESYAVMLLDPRPNADNSKIFEGKKIYGIEVTIPELASKCIYNLDPQHIGGDHTTAAIDLAILAETELPPEDAILTTIRPDLDSFGTMAIFNIRRSIGELTNEIIARVKVISEFDTYSKGSWSGKREMPSSNNPWPEGKSDLNVLNAAIMDFKVPADQRVRTIQNWLESGVVPLEYEEKVEKERIEMVHALESGEIKIDTETIKGAVVVESTHRAGIELGYRNAPVVIAINPRFQIQGGEPHEKYTIAQYHMGYIDLKAVAQELSQLEQGWGGSSTIIGSPQGKSSTLSREQIFEIVKKFLKKND